MSDKVVVQLLKEMGPKEIQTISPEATAQEAAFLMKTKGVGALVVVEDGKVVGIVSERDNSNKVVALDKRGSEIKVSEIMTTKVESVGLTTNLEECEERMERLHIRHLPVIDKGSLIGIVSIRDLLVSTREEEKQLVDHLKHFIGGPGG
jgi:CBS domain-containing protein